MFITAKDLNLEDFLQAVQFIPPKGMAVDYFVSPSKIDEPTPGYIEEDHTPSDSIVYSRKDPAKKIAQQDTPVDYTDASAPKIENTGPKAPVIPKETPISSLKCPFIDVLSNDNLGTDLLLKEDVGPFKKHTIFHCI